MALLSVQQPDHDGTTVTFSAASAGDLFPNDGDTIVLFDNGSGGNLTVDVTVAGTPGGLTLSTITSATIANGAIGAIGPFDPTLFNNSDGRITVAPSTTSSVTVAVVRVK